MWQKILEEALNMGWIDWTVLVCSVLYVLLAAREHISCWIFGILGSALWAWASFFKYQLWIDALLQLFYVAMGAAGLLRWKKTATRSLSISRMRTNDHLYVLVSGVLLSAGVGFWFATYTPTASPYWDAGTTIFSILATFLVLQKKLENWLYWIIIDLVYAGLYASRGAWLFVLIMVIYVVVAVVGYFRWKKTMAK